MSSTTTSGANTGAEASACGAVADRLHLVALELAGTPRSLSAASWLSSTTRMRQPARRRGRRRRAAARSRSRTSLRHGSTTRNSEPAPGAVAVRLDRAAGAARPAAATSVRPTPRPPWLRSSERLPCANSSKMCGSSSRVDADAVVAHADHRLAVAPALERRARCAPPSSVYLAALLSRLATTCDRRAKSPRSQTGASGSRSCSWWPRALDERAARSRRVRDDGAQVERLVLAARSCPG